MIPLSLVPTALFGLLSYRSRNIRGTFPLYLTAALLSPAIIPFTLTVMAPNVKLLLEKSDPATLNVSAKEFSEQEECSAHALVDRWALLNLGRVTLSAASALVGLWATLGPVDVIAVESVVFMSGANRMG
jgi:hypothetical protein